MFQFSEKVIVHLNLCRFRRDFFFVNIKLSATYFPSLSIDVLACFMADNWSVCAEDLVVKPFNYRSRGISVS